MGGLANTFHLTGPVPECLLLSFFDLLQSFFWMTLLLLGCRLKRPDEMWDLPKCYISACSNSVQYVRLHPILMSILLYDFKQLTQCISEVESIEAKVNSRKKKEWLTKKEEDASTRKTIRENLKNMV